ncbi:MAG TPA: hypothetical protein VKA91_07870 [Nitrososphaeraceae archaeon]|nr:hypothetical protein [Nitrososphaeraceae archaeon]
MLTTHQNQICHYCGMTRPEVVETEIYYKQGRKKRINYLCYEPRRTAHNNNNYNCYINYLDEIGYPKLQVAGLYDRAYQDILSIFISSPFLHNDKKLSGGKNMRLTTVLKIAYSISEPVRCYLNAVNKEKISDVCSLHNPKVWPIVWQLMYAEPLVEVVSSEDPLILRWKEENGIVATA